MQVALSNRDVKSSGVEARGTFGISHKAQAHIMTILRDTLYSDKVLAVLREYASNAWDAHKQSGKGHIPIEVMMPTAMSPNLVIRDFGMGMSEDTVFNVFTQYGDSTKRETNDAVGMMGIGSKSGFAYSDSFTVTSWHDGTKKVYIAVLDDSDVGEINKMHEEPCDFDEVGVEIQIAVRPADIYEFQRKAIKLFPYFYPTPKINLEMPKYNRNVTTHGFFSINREEDGWIAVQGCIPYRINIAQVQPELEAAGIWDALSRTTGGLFFPIGGVQVSASREELKYSTSTKKAIVSKFTEMIESYIADVLEVLNKDDLSDWEKRQKACFMEHTMKIGIPAKYKDWARYQVNLWGQGTEHKEPQTFILLRGNSQTNSIGVDVRTRFVIKDDPRSMEGFRLEPSDVVVRSLRDAPIDAVVDELETYIALNHLTGIRIARISDMNWNQPYRSQAMQRKQQGPVNQKYLVKSFQLKDDTLNRSTLSENWDIVTREPTDEDVFVIIEAFKVPDVSDFYRQMVKDREAAKALGFTMPTVYGYKSTEKTPIKVKDCKGTEYTKWREKFIMDMMTPKRIEVLQQLRWSTLFHDMHAWEIADRGDLPVITADLRKNLGEHPVTLMFEKHAKSKVLLAGLPHGISTHLLHLLAGVTLEVPFDGRNAYKAVTDNYPLIAVSGGVALLCKEHRLHWMNYIKLVDQVAAIAAHNV